MWARCDDRNSMPRKHSYSGTPDDWFSDSLLPNDFTGISFDFFVNWNTYQLSDQIWIKRIVDNKYYWPQLNRSTLEHDLYKCDTKAYVERLGAFADRSKVKINYQFFKESDDWHSHPQSFVSASIDKQGKISSVTHKSLSTIKNEIQTLSGGPVSVGSKGLTYSSTTLECYLANGDRSSKAAWPGDVDLLILDKNLTPIAILEYKKNTIPPIYSNHVPISDEQLSKYYPKPDQRKYDRLAILRDFLNHQFQKDIPIFNLYFPTWKGSTYMKIEHIIGDVRNLKSNPENVSLRPLPTTIKEMQKLTYSLITMI